MTYSTLASIVKYSYASVLTKDKPKFGFFCSETETFRRIADELGLVCLSREEEPLRYVRHPLVYLVEAADDICYQVMDMEDAHKLKLVSTEEVRQLFLVFLKNRSGNTSPECATWCRTSTSRLPTCVLRHRHAGEGMYTSICVPQRGTVKRHVPGMPHTTHQFTGEGSLRSLLTKSV